MNTEHNIESTAADNREHWKKVESELPDWLQAEVERYRSEAAEDPGYIGDFDADFLEYIVVAATLASYYVTIGEELIGHSYLTLPPALLPDTVRAFVNQNMTTGAQHSLAISLAKNHLIEQMKADENRLFTGAPSVPDVSFKARFAPAQ